MAEFEIYKGNLVLEFDPNTGELTTITGEPVYKNSILLKNVVLWGTFDVADIVYMTFGIYNESTGDFTAETEQILAIRENRIDVETGSTIPGEFQWSVLIPNAIINESTIKAVSITIKREITEGNYSLITSGVSTFEVNASLSGVDFQSIEGTDVDTLQTQINRLQSGDGIDNNGQDGVGVYGEKVVPKDLKNDTSIDFVEGEELDTDNSLMYVQDENDQPKKIAIKEIIDINENDKGEFLTYDDLLDTYPNDIAQPSNRAGWFALVIDDIGGGTVGNLITIEEEKIVWDVDTNLWTVTGHTSDVTRSEFDNLEQRVTVNENDILQNQNDIATNVINIQTNADAIAQETSDRTSADLQLQDNIDEKLDEDFSNYPNKLNDLDDADILIINDSIDSLNPKNVTLATLKTELQQDRRDKGTFANETAILATYPNGNPFPVDRAGWTCYNKETTTKWAWDNTLFVWFDTKTNLDDEYVNEEDYINDQNIINAELQRLENDKLDTDLLGNPVNIGVCELIDGTVPSNRLPQSLTSINLYPSLTNLGDPNSAGILVTDEPDGVGTNKPFTANIVEQTIKEFVLTFTTNDNDYRTNDLFDLATVYNNLEVVSGGISTIARSNTAMQNPTLITSTPVKLILDTELASTDLNIIDYDGSNDFILKSDNALGYTAFVNYSITNAVVGTSVVVMFKSFLNGIAIDNQDFTIEGATGGNPRTENVSITVPFRPNVVDEVITFEMSTGADSVTLTSTEIRLISNFSSSGEAVPTYIFKYEKTLTVNSIDYTLIEAISEISTTDDVVRDIVPSIKSKLADNLIANVGDILSYKISVSSNIDGLAGNLLIYDENETTQTTYNKAGASSANADDVIGIYRSLSQTQNQVNSAIADDVDINRTYELAEFITGSSYKIDLPYMYDLEDRRKLFTRIPANSINVPILFSIDDGSTFYNIVDYTDTDVNASVLSNQNIDLTFDSGLNKFRYKLTDADITALISDTDIATDEELRQATTYILAVRATNNQFYINDTRNKQNGTIYHIEIPINTDIGDIQLSTDNNVNYFDLVDFNNLSNTGDNLSGQFLTAFWDNSNNRYIYKQTDKIIEEQLNEKVDVVDFRLANLPDVTTKIDDHLTGYNYDGDLAPVINLFKTSISGDNYKISNNLDQSLSGSQSDVELIFQVDDDDSNSGFSKVGNGIRIDNDDKVINISGGGILNLNGVNINNFITITAEIYKNDIATGLTVIRNFDNNGDKLINLFIPEINAVINDIFTIKITTVASSGGSQSTFKSGLTFEAINIESTQYKIPHDQLQYNNEIVVIADGTDDHLKIVDAVNSIDDDSVRTTIKLAGEFNFTTTLPVGVLIDKNNVTIDGTNAIIDGTSMLNYASTLICFDVSTSQNFNINCTLQNFNILGFFYGSRYSGASSSGNSTNKLINCSSVGFLYGTDYSGTSSSGNSTNELIDCSGNMLYGSKYGTSSSGNSTNKLINCSSSGDLYGTDYSIASGIVTGNSTNELVNCSSSGGALYGAIYSSTSGIVTGNSTNKLVNCSSGVFLYGTRYRSTSNIATGNSTNELIDCSSGTFLYGTDYGSNGVGNSNNKLTNCSGTTVYNTQYLANTDIEFGNNIVEKCENYLISCERYNSTIINNNVDKIVIDGNENIITNNHVVNDIDLTGDNNIVANNIADTILEN